MKPSRAGMAELADAADLKSAALNRGVGVRVPLSAPVIPAALQPAAAFVSPASI